jgi:hypothetical protein
LPPMARKKFGGPGSFARTDKTIRLMDLNP